MSKSSIPKVEWVSEVPRRYKTDSKYREVLEMVLHSTEVAKLTFATSSEARSAYQGIIAAINRFAPEAISCRVRQETLYLQRTNVKPLRRIA